MPNFISANMFKIFDSIYSDKADIQWDKLCSSSAFTQDRPRSLGYVLQQLLNNLTYIATKYEHDGYLAEEWLDYKQTILDKICSSIKQK